MDPIRNSKEPLLQRARKGLDTIMDDVLRYFVVLALIFLAVWLIGKIASYFLSFVAPRHELVFVAADPADVNTKQAPQVLSAKLRRLQSYSKPPTGYGFLQVPVLGAVPKEAQRELKPLENLKDIKITIKDVDVNAVIKTVREVLSPPRYELRIHRIDLPDATEVSCDFFYDDKHKANWRSRARKPKSAATPGETATAETAAAETAAAKTAAGKTAAAETAAAEDATAAETAADTAEADVNAGGNDSGEAFDIGTLLDEVLFQMIFDFMTKEEFKGEWGIAMTKGDYQPQNWQTLQAYTRGVQALTAYQQTLDHQDLDEALRFLKKLSIVAPSNAYGLYYYGLALSENRQEDEAVAVFEQLQRVLISNQDARLRLSEDPPLPLPSPPPLSPSPTPIPSPNTSPTGAPAAPGDAPPAASPTAAPAASPTGAPPASPTVAPAASPTGAPPASPTGTPAAIAPRPKVGTEKIYYEAKFNEATARLKFYRIVPGERAAKTLEELITELNAKKADPKIAQRDRWYYSKMLAITYAQLAYTHATILSMLHDKNPPNMTAMPKEIADHWVIIKENLLNADNEFQVELRECWDLRRGTTEEQDQLQREKRDIEFRIKNAAGYSLFRWAEYWADLKQIPRFKELCEEAIRKLEEANVARPNHYEVLQNMAMIYEDKDYDPEGAYLDKAESLYLQTVGFVPNDYYQYERLALIQWRSMEGLPANPDLIRKGKQYALTSVKLRPHASWALLAMARLNVKSWENSQDKASTEAKAAVAEALEFFKRAIAARPKNTEFLAEYVQFLAQVADPKTTDANVALESGSALLEMARRDGLEPEPKKLLLDRAVQMLAKALELTKQKDTDEKKEMNARAQTLSDEAKLLLATP